MSIILSSFKDIADSAQILGKVFSATWYFVLPPLLFWAFKPLWIDHVQRKFLATIPYLLLEIIPPQNVEKSPKLMESFFAGIHGVITTIPNSEIYIKGRFIEYFSFELVGDSGKIHFYVRAPKWDRGIVESNLYAQYPDVQIVEAEDYVDKVPRILPNKKWEIWGADATLAGPDPLPIKTYTHFQEDVTGKMIDPLSSILEILGKLGPNQKIWFQIMVTPIKEDWVNTGKELVQELAGRTEKPKNLIEKIFGDTKDIFTNLFKATYALPEFPTEEKKEQAPLEFRLTPGERDQLKALEENIGKNVFRTKIRFAYIGRRENWDKPGVVGGFWGAMKQFSDLNSNCIGIYDPTKTYAWYILTKPRLLFRQRKLFQRYIDRDPAGIKFVLSTSELATIFHIPDMSAMAPAITRVEAKLGGAPANLPVE